MNIKVPKKLTKKLANTEFMYNNLKNDKDGLFFQNKKKGSKLKEEVLLCLTKESMLTSGVINGKDHHHFCFDITKTMLKQLLKKVEQKEKYFKAVDKKRKAKKYKPIGKQFFVHVNPELSFYVKVK